MVIHLISYYQKKGEISFLDRASEKCSLEGFWRVFWSVMFEGYSEYEPIEIVERVERVFWKSL